MSIRKRTWSAAMVPERLHVAGFTVLTKPNSPGRWWLKWGERNNKHIIFQQI